MSEKNYGITELEGLAIIYCVNKLRNYLLGRHFIILTDHCALCALKLKMPNSPWLRRWALILSEYNFSIQYIKASLHNDVDCLSRAPVDCAEDKLLDGKVLVSLQTTNYACIVVAIEPEKWKNESESDQDAKQHYIKARARQRVINFSKDYCIMRTNHMSLRRFANKYYTKITITPQVVMAESWLH